MFQYHPSNPMRPPTYRWEFARILRENKGKQIVKVAKEDPYIHAAYKFQLGLSRCKDDVDRWELMEKWPDIYGAYLIFRRGEAEDKHPMKYALEARLLAGQSITEIAYQLGISVKAVEYYERLFFSVTDKLKNQDYIMTCIIGPSVQAGLTDRDYDLLWKLFGYLYGPTVLDSFISTTTRKFRPETMNEVDAALAEDTRTTIQRKVAVVARTFTVNAFSQSELLNVYTRFLEIERETGGDKSHDVILGNIQVMLDKLPWRAGDDTLKLLPANLAKHELSNSELRTDELLRVSVGQDIAEETELKFPEKEKA